MGIKVKINKIFSKEKTIKQKSNLLLSYIQYKLRNKYLYTYPVKLRIDPCNHCNLQCALCPVGTKTPGRKQSVMKFDVFKKILDECGKYVWEVDLFNWGEPLLNKNIFKMINYARNMKIDVAISTNLNHFNDYICANLVESGLNTLIVSLDGASQESVEMYQKGSDFNSVIHNIKQVVYMKEKLKSKLPFIQWRFLINKYNENEVDNAKALSKKLKVDKLELGILRCDMGNEILLTKDKQYENIKPWLPNDETLSMYDYSKKQKKHIGDICRFLWYESDINPNGSVSPCCATWHDKFDFGNVNDSSFREIWNNDKYQQARRISRGDGLSVSKHICYICKINNSQI